MLVDFNYSNFSLRGYDAWKARADKAKIAFAPFGGGPYYGYEVGVIDAMQELGILPDAILPGCVGNFVGLYHLMALVDGKPGPYYVDQFSAHGLMKEKDYLKAPIPPLFPMRLSAWMRGFVEYYQKPEAYKDIYAPELFPDVVKAGMTWLTSPTERNYAQWLRNLLVWSPVTRLGLGGYFFAPIGPFGELYDYTNPEGWIAPAIDWKSVYTDEAPVYMMSLLRVGADNVTVATNCGDHPAFVPVDGRRLASASNLPWLIAETNINGEWYRESAVRDAATLTSAALESLPELEVMIAVQIMASPETGHLSIHQGNHNNYSLQVTEMVATIGDDDIHQAKDFFKQKGQDVEWITVEATPDSNPYWTFENINRCRAQGYASAMRQFLNSPKLASHIKHWPDAGKKTPATADVKGVHRLATTRSNRRAATS